MNPTSKVHCWQEELTIPTYLPADPDCNPMFLEKRVYQGSSGKVYPLPFIDRIAEKPVDRKWRAVWIENDYLRVLVLPEIGGRIHAIQDKTNGYDLIYRQHVIKPALVGLAGPWASGGIEFNWPQHHRPATWLPVDHEIEEHPDGSKTIWCSDHDPMCRMKGMHGVCLHPDRAVVELKVRAYNRTPLVQTFLWWANVATRVHEGYQSFFPPDVYYIADHAKRAMSEYPRAKGHYYGVNYGERGRNGIPESEIPRQFVPTHCQPPSAIGSQKSAIPSNSPNDLSFYANIPVPTSYMCMGSREDFFGGYDHRAQAGIIHIANHHISPGKKQWTWGNHEFGYAWDRNLTDKDERGEYGPYIEIMAGVYTDNQPDFSLLQPGETKAWSQYWYPIQKIGPAQHANLQAALSLKVEDGEAHFGLCVTQNHPGAKILLTGKDKKIFDTVMDLTPGAAIIKSIKLPQDMSESDLRLSVNDSAGKEIIAYQRMRQKKGAVPPPATEPPPPSEIASVEELFITGLHLEQYRHATRSPLMYWQEGLRRDPSDSRCNNALGLWHLKRGEFTQAENHFRQAIARLTRRNPNPYDGEAYYNLGLCLRHLGHDDTAYDAFFKSVWNQAWMAPGYHALAEIDCARQDWTSALDHLNRSLNFNTTNHRARNLKAMVLRRLHHEADADAMLRETLATDPLDWWARYLNCQPLECDQQTAIDLAHDLTRAGFYQTAIDLLITSAAKSVKPASQGLGTKPIIAYTLGWLHTKTGDSTTAGKYFKRAAAASPDYCFPARLEEITILQTAIQANPRDARALYYLGNLFYDRRRHTEAVKLWEKSAQLDNNFSIVWRNLGIGYFNNVKNARKARAAYDRAFKANPADARLLYERDQLWKRLGESPAKRLAVLTQYPDLVARRDDLSVELCALHNQTGRHREAQQLLGERNFQPWEGGEGGPLGQHVRCELALGRAALAEGESSSAISHFKQALSAPRNLGEAKHLLANQSDIHYWLGCALENAGEKQSARDHWKMAATFKGDFQEMSVRAFSEMTYYSALSWKKLGQSARATHLLRNLLRYAQNLRKSKAKIDYFTTSLPTMLIFEDDIQFRQETTALFLQAQARLGLGQKTKATALLRNVLKRDPNHPLAADLYAEISPAK